MLSTAEFSTNELCIPLNKVILGQIHLERIPSQNNQSKVLSALICSKNSQENLLISKNHFLENNL